MCPRGAARGDTWHRRVSSAGSGNPSLLLVVVVESFILLPFKSIGYLPTLMCTYMYQCGTLGHWDIGTFGHWDVGTLGHWDIGTFAMRRNFSAASSSQRHAPQSKLPSSPGKGELLKNLWPRQDALQHTLLSAASVSVVVASSERCAWF